LSNAEVVLQPITVATGSNKCSDATIQIFYTITDQNGFARKTSTTQMVRVPTGNPEKGAAKAIRAVVEAWPNKKSIIKVGMVNFCGKDASKTPDIDLTLVQPINTQRATKGRNNGKKATND